MTGKVADVVMSVRFGEQIARKYQPVIHNPKSSAQTAVRAKMKLMSQLSAVMAPVIAMPREGAVSTRNLFTKVNFGSTNYSDDTASITLTSVKLTRGVLSLPSFTAVHGTGALDVALRASATLDVSRVVYVAFRKMADGTLRLAGSVISSAPGANNQYAAQITVEATDVPYVVYAYGVRDNTNAARVKFGDMTAPTAQSVAMLIVNRVLTDADITLTETQAAEVNPA